MITTQVELRKWEKKDDHRDSKLYIYEGKTSAHPSSRHSPLSPLTMYAGYFSPGEAKTPNNEIARPGHFSDKGET